MKKLLLFLCASLLVGYLHGQRFAYGLSLSSQYFAKNFEDNGYFVQLPPFGMSTSADIYFKLKPRFHIKSGVQISYIPLEERDYSVILSTDVHPNKSVDIYNSWIEVDYLGIYAGVPIEGRYFLSSKSRHPYILFGGSMLFLMFKSGNNNFNSRIPFSSGNAEAYYEPAKHQFFLHTGFGYEYSMREKVVVFVELRIARSLNDGFDGSSPFTNVDITNPLVHVGVVLGVSLI